MFGLGIPELLIVAGVIILLFGSAKLPKLMRSMGQSINEFKQGMEEKPRNMKSSGNINSDSDVE